MSSIYKITNKVNNDFYIGKTSKTIEERFAKHISNHKSNIQTHLYRAFHKYGCENFSIELLEEILDETKVNDKEIEYISKLSPQYNMTKGGDGGNTIPFFTDEMRTACIERSTGKNNPMYGKRGPLNPKYGKTYRKCPKISKALCNPCMCDGIRFEGIGLAETYFKNKNIKVSVRKRLNSKYHPTWFRLVPKRKYPNSY